MQTVQSASRVHSLSLHEAVLEVLSHEPVSVVVLLDALINAAHSIKASDIHIDPEQNELIVRFRIDGELHERYALSKGLQDGIIARIKVLAELRTDLHREPQDGRFRFETNNAGPIDIRVSIVPTYHGENVVLRLLAPLHETFALEDLGIAPADREVVETALTRPYGMILATGPTGCGKTTTLYTLLSLFNTSSRSIVTIEDPIEYAMRGIRQMQVSRENGVTFAEGLRSILRQDPNIIMVGEIRDAETARLSVNAALTGHIVLSTLHTNDAPTAIPRLFDMGIEPYIIASTVSLVVAQRLARRICPLCKIEARFSTQQLSRLREVLPSVQKEACFYRGLGCESCTNGYQGRIGIFEIMPVTEIVREAIAGKVSIAKIRTLMKELGIEPMLVDGVRKAEAGITTLEEVLRLQHE